jgi:hypothetical protein
MIERGVVMMHRLAVSFEIFAALGLAGCASVVNAVPAASPTSSARAECERNEGVWRTALNYCEVSGKE